MIRPRKIESDSIFLGKGGTIQSPGGGGARVYVADKLFISIRLGDENFKFYYMFI